MILTLEITKKKRIMIMIVWQLFIDAVDETTTTTTMLRNA